LYQTGTTDVWGAVAPALILFPLTYLGGLFSSFSHLKPMTTALPLKFNGRDG